MIAGDPGWLRALERIEAHAWQDLYQAVPELATRVLKPACEALAGGALVLRAQVDVMEFNRVLGVGIDAPASPALVDLLGEVCGPDHVPPLAVQLAPTAMPPHLRDWLEVRGFRAHEPWVKWARSVEDAPGMAGRLSVERIDRGRAGIFGQVVVASYGWPEELAVWLAAGVGRGGWRHYLAYDREEPTAAAALYIDGDMAWMGLAGTLAGSRGRGAQTALIARRVQDAARAGSEWLAAETLSGTEEHPDASFRNLKRAGFVPTYERTNLIRALPSPG